MNDDTFLNHPPLVSLPEGNKPLVEPIYQNVKFSLEPWRELAGPELEKYFFYSRAKNPTVRQLELILAELQRCEDCVAVGSGVAAISCALISILKSGDHVLLFLESYKPSRHIVRDLLGKFGIEHSFLSIADVKNIASRIRPGKTKVIFFESSTNPMTRIADIDSIVKAAKQYEILTVLDNTFAGFHNHRNLPIDIYVHSLTKFASGHGDVMGGAILASKRLLENVRDTAIHLGPVLDPHAAFLIARGLKTYFLRIEKQCSNALKVAKFLEKHPSVAKVYYPGLPSHPDHALAKEQLADFGSILAFELGDAFAGTTGFLRNLKLFKVTASVGSTESLAAPAKSFFATDLSDEELRIAGISDRTVRLSIGIESSDDLLADLDHALKNRVGK